MSFEESDFDGKDILLHETIFLIMNQKPMQIILYSLLSTGELIILLTRTTTQFSTYVHVHDFLVIGKDINVNLPATLVGTVFKTVTWWVHLYFKRINLIILRT